MHGRILKTIPTNKGGWTTKGGKLWIKDANWKYQTNHTKHNQKLKKPVFQG